MPVTTRKPKRKLGKSRRPSRLGLLTLFLVLVVAAAFGGLLQYTRPHLRGQQLRVDTFVDLVGQGQIRSARILGRDEDVVGTYIPHPTSGATSGGGAGALNSMQGLVPGGSAPVVTGTAVPYYVSITVDLRSQLITLLISSGVPTVIDQQSNKRFASDAVLALPLLLIMIFIGYMALSYRRRTGLFGGRTGARKFGSKTPGDVTFADVAGQTAAVVELQEIRDFLAEPSPYFELGAEFPKGVLLYGPPGCGKTMLAKALANESGANFFAMSGSDFVEIYVGVGAARVRELFRSARSRAPAIVFIDELDAIGRSRGMIGVTPSHSEQEQALNQVLTEMDGFTPGTGVIVVGATNRPDVLDAALLRPGRFDRTIGLERPDESARAEILRVHAAGKRIEPSVDLRAVAKKCVGFTGADLANVMNESALFAARARKRSISEVEINEAVKRILDAPERQRRLSLRERSIGRRYTGSEGRITFADVAGVDDAVQELTEVRDFLAEPERFAKLGARVPRGILLTGPPGCGKTLLARAVAGEANAAFIAASGSDFVELFVGTGAARVRQLFSEARSLAPAIVFIDEIDSLGQTRSVNLDGVHEREQTLNQILVELDGFSPSSGVIVMAATNRPDILDPALVRPGRFDRQVRISPPTREGRLAILELHARDKHLGRDVRLEAIAGLTRGFSGADLANVLNEAALLAARANLDEIPLRLVEEGVDRAFLGIASRGLVLSDEDRLIVAYHEAGHALVGNDLPGAAAPYKVTVLPRGESLGRCTYLDKEDRVLLSRSAMLDRMATSLAGWAAERLVFGDSGTGPSSDLEQVADTARRMVRTYGMSQELGPLVFPVEGRNELSEYEAQMIYTEVRQIIDEARRRAEEVLTRRRWALDRIARALLDRETISAEDVAELVRQPDSRLPVPPLANGTVPPSERARGLLTPNPRHITNS